MAQRRMFSKEITNSSDFQMMSHSAQCLYFHIGMNADDDGFCEVFTIVRMTESKPDDLRSLHERGLIYIVDTKVCIVKDWHTNNYVQNDRYQKSKYLDDTKYGDVYKTIMSDKIAQLQRYSEYELPCIQDVSIMDTQVRLGKVRLGKEKEDMSVVTDTFEQFWSKYPKKELKKKAFDIWTRRGLSKKAPTIVEFVEKAKDTDRWKKGFIKQPTAFLNGECWNDDLASYSDLKFNNQPRQTEVLRIN